MTKIKEVKRVLTPRVSKNGSVSYVEGTRRGLKDKKGNLTIQGIETLRETVNNPIWHTPLHLGIKEFKRFLKRVPMVTKQQYQQQVREYKAKAWSEYDKIVKYKGNFPTRTM